ncbi:MAG: prepilin-type N-terminal cleavage/methylation domain-containing protein [Campylobacteraceae bacterium]|nr:prepilin-type N-terminal cleavage/methylation domain-containing protein [Campylobacteraceae bacterium]
MKKAFTMLELVFVIVVVGILSAMIAPNFQRNSVREAADQLISHIRYTQHLAMMDDMYDPNDSTWFQERWQLIFAHNVESKSVWAYTIFSDSSNHDGNVNIGDTIAKNPLNNKQYLSGGYSAGVIPLSDNRRMKNLALEEKYGVTSIVFSNGCNIANRIAFDYLGRPMQGSLNTGTFVYQASRLLVTPCDINLSDGSKSITIAIEPETGYAHIL